MICRGTPGVRCATSVNERRTRAVVGRSLRAGIAAVGSRRHGVDWTRPVLRCSARRSCQDALGLGFLWGVAHHWATSYWVLPAMSTYYEQPLWLAFAFGIVTSPLYRGSYGALFAAVASFAGSRIGAAENVACCSRQRGLVSKWLERTG